MNYPLEYIRWLDHVSFHESMWRTLPEVHSLEPFICHSVGYVIKETDEYIVLAQTIAPQEELEDQWVGEMLIAKPLIKERKKLK